MARTNNLVWLKAWRPWSDDQSSQLEVLWLANSRPRLESQLWILDGVPWIEVPSVKSLGVTLDNSLSMEAQVTKVARLAFLQLCHIRQLASYFSHSDLATVIHTTVTSRLD